jgi:glycosyltransferase involved in cell wall biosynthesis
MPEVSVIIPTYRHSRTVLESLDSVFTQSFSDVEVIVVNDGSPDDTAKVLQPLVDSGKIKYIEQANQGQSAARNRGLREASGEFIAFLDDDDLWPADKLSWQIEYLNAYPSVVAVGGACQRFSNSGVVEEPIGYDEGRITPTLVTHGNPFISPGQTLIRAAELNELGGFDESLWGLDDMDLWFRLALKWRVERVSRLALLYRLHGMNASKDSVRMYQSCCRMVRKHLRLLPRKERKRIGQSYYSWIHNYLGCQIAFSYGLRAIGRKPFGETHSPPWRKLPTFLIAALSSFSLARLTFRDVKTSIVRAVRRPRAKASGIPNSSSE